MSTVALFVTCMVDQVVPDVGIAAVRLLEVAGCEVEFPAAQTCCGQPGITAGQPEAAAALATHFVDVFGGYDAVVTPSGSCAATVRHWYPRLLPERAAAVDEVARRTYELGAFLVDGLGRSDLGARLDTTVAVHDACHGLRHLGLGTAPRALLTAAGATVVELAEPESCCGFGGTFSLEHGEVAVPLADRKLADATATGADWLVSGDVACVLHLQGRRRRTGAGPEPVHWAELLAGALP